jgi:hypothetical protein
VHAASRKANETLISTTLPTDQLLCLQNGFQDVNGKKTTQIRGGSGVFTGKLPLYLGNQVVLMMVSFKLWIKL